LPEHRRRWSFAALLAALTMPGPFAIDMYLPAFGAIAREFDASPLAVRQILSSYLFAYAFMMMWHRPLADALVRRPVMLAGIALYALGSLGCAIARNIESPQRPIGLGYACMVAGVTLNVIVVALVPPSVPWHVVPIGVYTFGSALMTPSVTLLLLDLYPTLRGRASSLQGFVQFAFPGVTAGAPSHRSWRNRSAPSPPVRGHSPWPVTLSGASIRTATFLTPGT
jgi:MFS family permease